MSEPVTIDTVSDDAVQVAASHQATLFSLLCCPVCNGDVSLDDQVVVAGSVVAADISCSACGLVGLVEACRASFLDRDLNDPDRLPGFIREHLDLRPDRLATSGSWRPHGEALIGLGVGAVLGGVASGVGVQFELTTGPWSGRVLLQVDGAERVVDLFSSTSGSTRIMVLAESSGDHAWSICITDGAQGDIDQVIVETVCQVIEPARSQPNVFEPKNLGNPYPPRFEELLASLPADARVLDLGGGDRRHPDHRVINLEYLPYRRVDLYADGLRLPFREASFDLVLSQAVLEHVPDPPQAVSEIRRVLKPGAQLYAEFAFMQPLHAVPFHFYNITPHGAHLLFDHFGNVSIGAFGGLGETMRWFFRLLEAEAKIGADDVAAVLSGLDRLDSKLSHDELSMISSAVSVEAIRPL